MGIPAMILGESGSGKTTSLRNLNPDEVVLIQAVNKPLPFRNDFKPWDSDTKTGTIIVTDQSKDICRAIAAFPNYGKKIIIIDDYQYTMANEYMRRSSETGFTKFTEIARHAWNIAMAAQSAPNDVRIYLLSHVNHDDQGRIKAKTIGKMLDEKITLEGLFTIVMRAVRENGEYLFTTQNNGNDTVKTPMDLFQTETIDNDLNAVDQAIKQYYNIQG